MTQNCKLEWAFLYNILFLYYFFYSDTSLDYMYFDSVEASYNLVFLLKEVFCNYRLGQKSELSGFHCNYGYQNTKHRFFTIPDI